MSVTKNRERNGTVLVESRAKLKIEPRGTRIPYSLFQLNGRSFGAFRELSVFVALWKDRNRRLDLPFHYHGVSFIHSFPLIDVALKIPPFAYIFLPLLLAL